MTRAWWFAPPGGRLGYDDGRVVRKGITHRVSKCRKLELCDYGLHAARLPLDALDYAYAGAVAWRVEVGGEIVEGDDKLCGYNRTYLERVPDTDAVLCKFARLCALDVTHLWDAPDVVVRYLKTGDESIRVAARAAVYAAARAAADYAACAAADYAARAVGFDAADAAADAAAYAAALEAAAAAAAADASAFDDAYDATRNKQNKRLHRMLMQAIREER